jgi:hypothetical protein
VEWSGELVSALGDRKLQFYGLYTNLCVNGGEVEMSDGCLGVWVWQACETSWAAGGLRSQNSLDIRHVKVVRSALRTSRLYPSDTDVC